MLWLLLLWGLEGPAVHAVLRTKATCDALLESAVVTEAAAVRVCVPLAVDDVVHDVVPFDPANHSDIKVIR